MRSPLASLPFSLRVLTLPHFLPIESRHEGRDRGLEAERGARCRALHATGGGTPHRRGRRPTSGSLDHGPLRLRPEVRGDGDLGKSCSFIFFPCSSLLTMFLPCRPPSSKTRGALGARRTGCLALPSRTGGESAPTARRARPSVPWTAPGRSIHLRTKWRWSRRTQPLSRSRLRTLVLQARAPFRTVLRLS